MDGWMNGWMDCLTGGESESVVVTNGISAECDLIAYRWQALIGPLEIRRCLSWR